MDIQQLTTRAGRVDDIPLLLAQMRKIYLAELINQDFQAHGNWQGLSYTLTQATTASTMKPPQLFTRLRGTGFVNPSFAF
jgi:hypothetical protein